MNPRQHVVCCVDGCEKPHHAKGYCQAHYHQHRDGTLGGVDRRRQDVPEGMRQCSKCGEVKPLDEFYLKRIGRPQRAYTCKVCARLANRIRRTGSAEKEMTWTEFAERVAAAHDRIVPDDFAWNYSNAPTLPERAATRAAVAEEMARAAGVRIG